MSERKNLQLIEQLTATVKTQGERIDTLQKALNTVLERNPQLVGQDKPKMLDQSVFDGQDDDYRYAVISIEGGVFLFAKKPKIVGGLWSWDVANDKQKLAVKLGTYDASNWQNSLIEREAKREVLDGNERIRRLLEKQKFVMVMVSDDGYTDALSGSELRICDHFNHHDGLYTIDGGAWSYGIPIDNNGNEILDVE